MTSRSDSAPPDRTPVATLQKAPTGIKGLDEITGGGFPVGRSGRMGTLPICMRVVTKSSAQKVYNYPVVTLSCTKPTRRKHTCPWEDVPF